ncbi:MAG TPA: hypothetical protein VD930_08595 [Gemmatimonadales bacterium]|nr:hypothetical protein [Gemmatimonadales bacterium]
MKSMHVLLRNAIDYAGLFPPAGLDMQSAVSNFAAYSADENSWALGRFVVPVSRLDEFMAAAWPYVSAKTSPIRPWRLAALCGPDLGSDMDAIERFNGFFKSSDARLTIDTLERKAVSVEEIKETMHRVPAQLQAFLELPVDSDAVPLIHAMAGSRVRAKVRTGGITADAFPRPADLLGFIDTAIRASVPFKATAGLHHPLRAEYRLTYAPDSARGRMFGFLNLFLVACGLHYGMEMGHALDLLQEESPASLVIENDGIRWRDYHWGVAQLEVIRREAIIAFGSCSFTEPIGELQALNLLLPRVPQA